MIPTQSRVLMKYGGILPASLTSDSDVHVLNVQRLFCYLQLIRFKQTVAF